MWISLFLMLFTLSALATPQSFEIDEGKKVTVEVPEGWEAVRDLFGIPLTVLGPWANESRPVLTFLFTNLTSKKVTPEDFQKVFVDFKKDKDEWVKSHQGTLLSFDDAKAVKLRADLHGHFIGAEFKINDVHFIERSYYLYCKDEVYNLKYSIRDEHRPYLPLLQEMVGKFQCK